MLHHRLCLPPVKVRQYSGQFITHSLLFLGWIFIFVNSRYIDIRSQDPLDRDHKGVKLKKKTAPVKGASAEEQKCFFKDEWWCKLRKMYFYIVFNKFPFPLLLSKSIWVSSQQSHSYVILLNDNSRMCVWDTEKRSRWYHRTCCHAALHAGSWWWWWCQAWMVTLHSLSWLSHVQCSGPAPVSNYIYLIITLHPLHSTFYMHL